VTDDSIAVRDPALWPWRRAMAFAGSTLLLLWILLSVRSTPEGFPNVILTAEGLLLTATVFILGFSQNQQRRVIDRVLSDLLSYQEAVSEAYRSDPNAMPTSRLWELAALQLSEANEAEQLARKDPGDLVRSLQRLRLIDEAGEDITSVYLTLDAIGKRLDGPDAQVERLKGVGRWRLRRRQRRLTMILRRLDARQKRGRQESGRAGRHQGLRTLAIGFGAAYESLAIAKLFLVAMLELYVAGARYAGWRVGFRPAPAWWAVFAFIGLGAGYIFVVRRDLRDQIRESLFAVETAPFAMLLQAERILDRAVVFGEDFEVAAKRWDMAADSIAHAERRLPQSFGWTASLAARRDLTKARILAAQGGDTGDPWFGHRSHRLYEARALLTRAERTLRTMTRTTDDSLAAVTLACVIEQQQLLSSGTSEVPPECHKLLAHARATLKDSRSSTFTRGGIRWEALQAQRRWLPELNEIALSLKQPWLRPQAPELSAVLDLMIDEVTVWRR
jgi:hypothetical protein